MEQQEIDVGLNFELNRSQGYLSQIKAETAALEKLLGDVDDYFATGDSDQISFSDYQSSKISHETEAKDDLPAVKEVLVNDPMLGKESSAIQFLVGGSRDLSASGQFVSKVSSLLEKLRALTDGSSDVAL